MEIKNRYWDKRREDMFSLNSTLTLVCFRLNILDQKLITGYGGWAGLSGSGNILHDFFLWSRYIYSVYNKYKYI